MNFDQYPLVSVIAVCYNQEAFLEETLESIRLQTYKNVEVIIIDDLSTDKSVQRIQQWIRKNNIDCTFIKNPKNFGVCKTLNIALKKASGKYIQLIACDDIMLSNKLERQVEILEKNPSRALVFSDAYLMNENSETGNGRFMQQSKIFFDLTQIDIHDTLLRTGNFICAPTALIRADIFNRYGGYDESIIFEDYEFWLRVSHFELFYFDEFVSIKYRIRSNSLSRNYSLEYWISHFNLLFNHVSIYEMEKEKAQNLLISILMKIYAIDTKMAKQLAVRLRALYGDIMRPTYLLMRAGIGYKWYMLFESIRGIFN